MIQERESFSLSLRRLVVNSFRIVPGVGRAGLEICIARNNRDIACNNQDTVL